MSTKKEIRKAIEAHAAWKQKLRDAIDTGVCESTPEKVKQDNNCAFGKWLHKRIDKNAKQTPHYAESIKLHAKFHQQAGSILELALTGSPEKANALMAVSQPFARYSAALTLKLKDWKEAL